MTVSTPLATTGQPVVVAALKTPQADIGCNNGTAIHNLTLTLTPGYALRILLVLSSTLGWNCIQRKWCWHS
jgi:hypothetical protein